jgi:hypothetical protein
MQTLPNLFIASLFQNHTYQKRCFVPKNCWDLKKFLDFSGIFFENSSKMFRFASNPCLYRNKNPVSQKYLIKTKNTILKTFSFPVFQLYESKNSKFFGHYNKSFTHSTAEFSGIWWKNKQKTLLPCEMNRVLVPPCRTKHKIPQVEEALFFCLFSHLALSFALPTNYFQDKNKMDCPFKTFAAYHLFLTVNFSTKNSKYESK